MEDNVESGAKDAVGQIRNATGSTDATEDANRGLENTVGAAKGTARDVEDQVTESGGDVVAGVSGGDVQGAGKGVKDGVVGTAGGVGEGAKGVVGGGAETVKGGVGALGSGAKSAGGAVGGLTGLGGGGGGK